MFPRSRNESIVGQWSAVAPPSCYYPDPPPGQTEFRPRQPCGNGFRGDFNSFNGRNQHSPPQRFNNNQRQTRFTQQQQFTPPGRASNSRSSERLGVHAINEEMKQFKAGTWVETETPDGGCYYYHAESRETTWSRPVGFGINIILHKDFGVEITSRNQASPCSPVNVTHQIPPFYNDNVSRNQDATNPTLPLKVQSPQLTSPSEFSSSTMNSGTPSVPIMVPPPFSPFHMPFMMNLPWNPAPQMPLPGMPLFPVPPPAIYIPPHVEPSVVHAHEWSVHVSPEGMAYYHNSKTGVSSWEKPEPLKQLELLVTKEAPPVCSSTSEERVLRSPKHKPNPKEKKKTAVAGVTQTSSSASDGTEDARKPALCKHVVGTSWCIVITNDKKMFYFNAMKKESIWERPVELFARQDVDEIINAGFEELRKKPKKMEIAEASSTTFSPPSTKSKSQPSASQTQAKKKDKKKKR